MKPMRSRAVPDVSFPHHHPSNGHAAGVFVSNLFHGAARHSHRVQLAWQVVMGFFLLHGGSLAAAAGALYGESFSEVDIWN